MSETPKRLTAADAQAKATECRELARYTNIQENRIMLIHMAETWDRIAKTLHTNGDT